MTRGWNARIRQRVYRYTNIRLKVKIIGSRMFPLHRWEQHYCLVPRIRPAENPRLARKHKVISTLTSVEYSISWIFFNVSTSFPSASAASMCACTNISMSRSCSPCRKIRRVRRRGKDELLQNRNPALSRDLQDVSAFPLAVFEAVERLRLAA